MDSVRGPSFELRVAKRRENAEAFAEEREMVECGTRAGGVGECWNLRIRQSVARCTSLSALHTARHHPLSPSHFLIESALLHLTPAGSSDCHRGEHLTGRGRSEVVLRALRSMVDEKPTPAADGTTTSATQPMASGKESAVYPPPVSSYYFGPPDSTRAFGEPVTGQPGVHFPKEIVRYVQPPPVTTTLAIPVSLPLAAPSEMSASNVC